MQTLGVICCELPRAALCDAAVTLGNQHFERRRAGVVLVLAFVPATKTVQISFPLCFCSITCLTLSSCRTFIFSFHSTPGMFSQTLGAAESKKEPFALSYGSVLAVETFMNPSAIELF